MGLPEKSFFSIDEVAVRWGVDRATLQDYARHERLVFSVYRPDLGSHTTVRETDSSTVTTKVVAYRFNGSGAEPKVPSPLYLASEDARRLLEASPNQLVTVEVLYWTVDRVPHESTRYIGGRAVSPAELVVTAAERDRFEKKFGLKSERSKPPELAPLARLQHICRKFPEVVRGLQKRYAARDKYFEVADEYDLQDLMHGLLMIDFEDIRREDSVPSHAGRNSRIDFLLHEEELGLELKMMRPGLKAKELGEQLTVDIERYRAHPRCKALVCMVYDPKHQIENHRGIERDLSRANDALAVHVLIVS